MNARRWSTAAVILTTAWGLNAQAQVEAGRGDDGSSSHFRERVRNALNLTKEQTEELRALRADLTEQLELLRGQVQSGELIPEDARVHYRRAMRIHRAGRDEILTEEQKALLERARRFVEEERLAGSQERKRHRLPHARLAEALELTAEQKAQWRELLQQQRQRVQELREEGEVLSRDAVGAVRERHRNAFEAILTPEQAAKLEEIRDTWRRRQEEEDAELDFGIEEDGTAVEEESWGSIKSWEP